MMLYDRIGVGFDRRSGMSALVQPDDTTSTALARLPDDIATGAWKVRYGELLDIAALDIGYRLVTVDLGGPGASVWRG